MIHEWARSLASGFLGVGLKVLFRPWALQPPSCVGCWREGGGREDHNHRVGEEKAAVILAGPGGRKEEERKDGGGRP